MARYKRKPVEHPGAKVKYFEDSASLCNGCDRNEESELVVSGYKITDRQDVEGSVWLCKQCAMRLAVEIMEMEVG